MNSACAVEQHCYCDGIVLIFVRIIVIIIIFLTVVTVTVTSILIRVVIIIVISIVVIIFINMVVISIVSVVFFCLLEGALPLCAARMVASPERRRKRIALGSTSTGLPGQGEGQVQR